MKTILFSALCFLIFPLYGQTFSEKALRQHIGYLASDKLGGRAPDTKGEKLAQKYVIKQFKKIGLLPKGTHGFLQPFTYNVHDNPHDPNSAKVTYETANIIGYLDNQAPYTIIIGAHADHLGSDGRHASLDANPQGKIHNGADDNASGVAGVIELAKYFAHNQEKEAVNFLFMCYSAEEAGLIGSKYYTHNPTIELKNIQCMLNMDMIGRLNPDTRALLVFGTGTSPDFEPLLQKEPTALAIKMDSSGVGPSDHTSFYLQNIPVLFFFTGAHADYHKPTDDIEKINFAGEVEVLQFIANLTQKLAARPKLSFLSTRTKEKEAVAFKVSLGIMPDYAYDKEGVRIDGVTDGKPAAKAGFQKGDIVIQIGNDAVKEIYSYMEILAKYKKGDEVLVKVKRGTEIIQSQIKF